jgi:hypothetical protein
LSYNEYIVYDESQIRLKYIVQLQERVKQTNSKGYPVFLEPKITEYSDEKQSDHEDEEMNEEEQDDEEEQKRESSSNSSSDEEDDEDY